MKQSLRSRDAGLSKISVTTRIAIAASVAATGLFTAVAAWAQPGHSKVSGPNAAGQTAGSGSATNSQLNAGNGTNAGGDTNLSPPPTLPAPGYDYNSPAVVSGAS